MLRESLSHTHRLQPLVHVSPGFRGFPSGPTHTSQVLTQAGLALLKTVVPSPQKQPSITESLSALYFSLNLLLQVDGTSGPHALYTLSSGHLCSQSPLVWFLQSRQTPALAHSVAYASRLLQELLVFSHTSSKQDKKKLSTGTNLWHSLKTLLCRTLQISGKQAIMVGGPVGGCVGCTHCSPGTVHCLAETEQLSTCPLGERQSLRGKLSQVPHCPSVFFPKRDGGSWILIDELPKTTVVSMSGIFRLTTISVPVIIISVFLYGVVTCFPLTSIWY